MTIVVSTEMPDDPRPRTNLEPKSCQKFMLKLLFGCERMHQRSGLQLLYQENDPRRNVL
jgi:hypothetical protein